MDFQNGDQLLELCRSHNCTISQAMLARECELFGRQPEDVLAGLTRSLEIMREGVTRSLTEELRSMGGLIGGEARKLAGAANVGQLLCGPLQAKAVTYAMGIMEVNASMGLIVAAPTAGSAGVVPGLLLALEEQQGLRHEQLLEGLLCAAAVGYLIAHGATISGAEGGCQAEVGAASAMGAAAVTQLLGGSPEQCLWAAATSLGNLLGLVCDPIAGLVEEPCQKRNAIGVANALVASQLALAGVSNRVPFDEMVSAMRLVGRALPFELRESGLGGIAGTCTGRCYVQAVQREE